jgi:hypothetical protein
MNTGNLDELRHLQEVAREARNKAQQARNQDRSDKGLREAAKVAQTKFEQARKTYNEAMRAK